jgi:phenylacetate-CoA ligase
VPGSANCAAAVARSPDKLGDVNLSDLLGPADLALIPVLRKSAIAALQEADPPFGGLGATPTTKFTRLFASPGGIYEPEQADGDSWGAGKGPWPRRAS